MILIEIQYRGRSRGVQRVPFLPVTDLLKSYNGKLKSVYYHITRFYNKTLTFLSFYCKIIGNYVILHISTCKIIIIVLVL